MIFPLTRSSFQIRSESERESYTEQPEPRAVTNCHRHSFAIVKIQKTVCLIVAGCLLVSEGLAQDSQDRFELFNYCYPMRIVVEDLSTTDAAEINLTKESIQAALESRLRSASALTRIDPPLLSETDPPARKLN